MKICRNNCIRIVIVQLLILAINGAQASVVWSWEFSHDSVLLSPTESFFIGGTISNSNMSTENLVINAFSWDITGGDLGASDFFGGLYSYNPTVNDQGGLLYNNSDLIIAPGQSYVFTMAHFDPLQPIESGTQFSWSVSLYHDFDGPAEEFLTRTIDATIVPVPSALWFMFSGLCALPLFRKK